MKFKTIFRVILVGVSSSNVLLAQDQMKTENKMKLSKEEANKEIVAKWFGSFWGKPSTSKL